MFSLEEGWKLALWFSVVLNVNLAVLNILPLPVVDGGHVVMNAVELVFRRPLNAKVLEFVQFGFVFLLMGFFLFVTFKDVGDFFGGRKTGQAARPGIQGRRGLVADGVFYPGLFHEAVTGGALACSGRWCWGYSCMPRCLPGGLLSPGTA